MSEFTNILSQISTTGLVDASGQWYRCRHVGDNARHFFGRDWNGFPCLLISSPDTASRSPIRLSVLDIRFSIPCHIVTDDGTEVLKTLTAIVCCSQDIELGLYFAHIAEVIVRIIGSNPCTDEIAEVVRRLIRLFESLSQPSTRTVVGLFGELYTIYVSRSPRKAVEAWRSSTDERFDFSIDDARLEVKSASDRVRAHSFSRDQCMPPAGTVAALISLFIETSGGGLSLNDLIQRIEVQLRDYPDLKLHEGIASTIGHSSTMAFNIRFDEHLARSSIKVFDLGCIPAIRNDLPSEISQVRFRSDLSYTPTARIEALIERSPILLELLPMNI